MKMLLTKTVFATSVALATLIAAETAYAPGISVARGCLCPEASRSARNL